MIGKKIKNPNPRSSKADRIKKLTDYIRAPGKEKCVYSGSRGFVCDDPKLQQTEMISLAMAATRSADPINHFVLSWREGERPSGAQAEEAVTIFMNECGLEGHMAVYGLHSDTDNFHLHLAINRVNPETEKVARINNGFDIEAAHKAIARIVKAQGWEPEENALFFVDDKGVLVDTRIEDRKDREQKPSSRAQDYEQRTGEKSAERIGIETLPEALEGASNWEEFHTKMSEHGMRYERKGSGAIIRVGEQAVIKASAADRGASLSKLEKRFGEYVGASEITKKFSDISVPMSQPLREEFSVNYGWNDYAKERREYFAEKKSAKLELDKRIDTEYKSLLAKQKVERDNVYGNGNWKGKGVLLNAMRSVVAAQHAGEKAELKEKHKEHRKEFSRKFCPFPDFEIWMRERGDEKGAELWRHRHESTASIFAPEPPLKVRADIRAFRHSVNDKSGRVDYFRENAGTRKPSFTDFGKRVEVTDWRDESVTLAALQLSAQKWPKGVFVRGNDEYKDMCVRLAVEHGIRILNPELQERIENGHAQKREEQERLEQELLKRRAERARQEDLQKKLEQEKQKTDTAVAERERERTRLGDVREQFIEQNKPCAVFGSNKMPNPVSDFVSSYGYECVRHNNGSIFYHPKGKPSEVAFVDKGASLELYENSDRAIVEMLNVAAKKWPDGFEVNGDKKFRERAEALAKERMWLGIKIKNPLTPILKVELVITPPPIGEVMTVPPVAAMERVEMMIGGDNILVELSSRIHHRFESDGQDNPQFVDDEEEPSFVMMTAEIDGELFSVCVSKDGVNERKSVPLTEDDHEDYQEINFRLRIFAQERLIDLLNGSVPIKAQEYGEAYGLDKEYIDALAKNTIVRQELDHQERLYVKMELPTVEKKQEKQKAQDIEERVNEPEIVRKQEEPEPPRKVIYRGR